MNPNALDMIHTADLERIFEAAGAALKNRQAKENPVDNSRSFFRGFGINEAPANVIRNDGQYTPANEFLKACNATPASTAPVSFYSQVLADATKSAEDQLTRRRAEEEAFTPAPLKAFTRRQPIINPGDMVRLRSGGAKMTYLSTSPGGIFGRCTWQSPLDHSILNEAIPLAALELWRDGEDDEDQE